MIQGDGMKYLLGFFIVFIVSACGAATEHLDLVQPYMDQINQLQSEKEEILNKDELTEIDKSKIENIDEEIDRITDDVNSVSRRYEEKNREKFETKNFYEGDRDTDPLLR